MAKMRWDRVRKENQARRSGSEWVGSDSPGLGPAAFDSKPPLIRKAVFGRSCLVRMPGCACNKIVGFVGQHRKTCSLRTSPGPVHPRTTSDPAHREYPECIKKQLSVVGDFLSSLQSQMNADHRIAESHQKNIRRLIQVLQDELRGTSNSKSDVDSYTQC